MPVLRKVIASGKTAQEGPEAKAFVAASGLSTRETATAYLAFFYTSRYLAEEQMRKAMGQTMPGPPAHVRPDNVELLRKNQDEIARMPGEPR